MRNTDTVYKETLRLCPTTDQDLLEIISWIPDKSSCKFSLNVYTANMHALNLYLKLDFKQRSSLSAFTADEPIVYLEKDQ